MKLRLGALVAFAALVGTVGCGRGHTLTDLRRRASFDLGCPEDQLEIVELGGRTRGVRGCGQQATYIQHCRDTAWGGSRCDWVMNTSGGQATGNVASPQNVHVSAPASVPTPTEMPVTPTRDAVVASMNEVSASVSACGQGAHGVAQVRIEFEGPTGLATGAYVVEASVFLNLVQDCIVEAARQARVPPFSQPTFSVSYPFRL